MYPPGDKEIIDFTPLDMVILFTEEEEEVEVEEEENGFRKDRWIDLMAGFRRGYFQGNGVGAQQAPTDRLQPDRQEEDWSTPANVERREDTERHETSQAPPPDVPPPQKKNYLLIGVV